MAAQALGKALSEERVPAVHAAPVWREKANFIIRALLPERDRSEQLWARQIGDQRFEVCRIPFFMSGHPKPCLRSTPATLLSPNRSLTISLSRNIENS